MATQATERPPEVIAIEMAKDRELRREERQALTAIPAANLAASPQRTSFIPQSMGEAMQLATIMSRSTFVPGHCRGSEGNCLAIIMQSARWGMDPFAVANKAYFVKDGAPPAFEAQLVNAVVNSSGALAGRLRIEFEGEGEKLRCTVKGRLRADPDDEKVRTQSISRITTRNSPLWKNDPEQQLGYYVTRAWARLHCPEVLLGVYTPDELEVEMAPVRAISSTPPRRDAIEHRQSIADELGDEIPAFDKDTGEVRDSRSMSEVSEETARALDEGQTDEFKKDFGIEQDESADEDEAAEAQVAANQRPIDPHYGKPYADKRREVLEALTLAMSHDDLLAAQSIARRHHKALPPEVKAEINAAYLQYLERHPTPQKEEPKAEVEPEQEAEPNRPVTSSQMGGEVDILAELRGGIRNAKNLQYLSAIDDRYVKVRAGLPDEIVAELDSAIDAKRRALRKPAGDAGEGGQ